MPKIKWTDELSVKISAFDNEHKKLIDIFNNLCDVMSQGKSKQMLSDILVDLSNYTKTHFLHEEEAMKKHGYSGVAAHKKAHDEFISRLNEVQSQYASGNVRLGIPIFNFLAAWIENHIQKIDRNYSELFINAGMK